jgi:two-component system, OmpR family, sensor kinase
MRISGSRLPRRLRTRVLAGVVAVTLVALAAFDFAAATALRGYLIAQVDIRLQTVADLYRPPNPPRKSASTPLGKPSSGRRQLATRQNAPPGKPEAHLLPAPLDEYFIAVVHPGVYMEVVGGDPSLKPAGLGGIAASDRPQTAASGYGHGQVRLLAEPYDGGTLVISTSLSEVSSIAGRLEVILAVGSAAAAVIVFVGVAWVMRRGLRPVETMAAQADRITAGDLSDRVSSQDARTEVGRLGAALNGMLARIQAFIAEREASQEATRRFFADASHELRTPLASLRANAELYQQGALPGRPQVDEAMRRITIEAQRMSGLVDDMLRLARLDQHPARQHELVDLPVLILDCADRARAADPARAWHAHVAPGLVVTGDEELLRRAVDNLLANIRAHTPAGTVATITAATRGASVIIEVSDDGLGVPPGQLPLIFDRFYRAAAPSPRPGSGLGLAIVTAIANAHGGSAQATLNRPHGLRITLTLPASGQPCPARQPAVSTAPSSPRELAIGAQAFHRRPAAPSIDGSVPRRLGP